MNEITSNIMNDNTYCAQILSMVKQKARKQQEERKSSNMYYIRMNTCEPIKDEAYCSNHCERENGPKINDDGTGRFKHD